MKRLISAAVTGASMALLPLLVLAADPPVGPVSVEGRGVPAPGDMGMTVIYTLLALTGLFVVLAIGYLYRRERSLDWPFQAAAVPHDDHHDSHDAGHAAPVAPAASGGHH
ncbi:MAG: hypothetical protein O2822_05745 [Chloroflexi bacterium]|nr:hypothetical protein [Chloroflexota bacterium]